MADKIVSRPATDKYREEYDRIFGKKRKDGPQYGVVQSYNWRCVGPNTTSPEATERTAGTPREMDGLRVETNGVDADINKPTTEDGSDPSSK